MTASATRRACAQPSELVTTADRSTGRPGRLEPESVDRDYTSDGHAAKSPQAEPPRTNPVQHVAPGILRPLEMPSMPVLTGVGPLAQAAAQHAALTTLRACQPRRAEPGRRADAVRQGGDDPRGPAVLRGARGEGWLHGRGKRAEATPGQHKRGIRGPGPIPVPDDPAGYPDGCGAAGLAGHGPPLNVRGRGSKSAGIGIHTLVAGIQRWSSDQTSVLSSHPGTGRAHNIKHRRTVSQ